MKVTKEEKGILFHTLGLNYNKIVTRNHFVASTTHSDYNTLEALVQKELMHHSPGPSFLSDDSIVYAVTEQGKELALDLLKKAEEAMPKLTRSQRRYRAFIDSESDESFIDWLRNGYWNDYRAGLGGV